jgi:inhibitor of cysteine peptidase
MGKNTMSEIVLTEADTGKMIMAHVGDKIIINLKENPSTGYTWAVDKTDSIVLALQNSDYTPTPVPSGFVGAGGIREFVFYAQKNGNVHLQLKEWRAWEGDRSILKRFDVAIQIQS